ncbi:hypothetical protein BDW59DRAFT_156680 [Aspergillus cavernicola]|uniref:Uncharacterized protein n=1 Tax=Aspergillus cavernicola TaxID=176166 RepID=A0ABR4J2V8_9EURO
MPSHLASSLDIYIISGEIDNSSVTQKQWAVILAPSTGPLTAENSTIHTIFCDQRGCYMLNPSSETQVRYASRTTWPKRVKVCSIPAEYHTDMAHALRRATTQQRVRWVIWFMCELQGWGFIDTQKKDHVDREVPSSPYEPGVEAEISAAMLASMEQTLVIAIPQPMGEGLWVSIDLGEALDP